MKIGIIVHSHTGNTLYVAKKLKEELLAAGKSVSLERVVAENEEPSASANIRLKTSPEISGYDLLIFAGPVRGFSLSPVLKQYLSNLSLSGKKAELFVTQQFPHAWMGGNRAIKQMRQLCEANGAEILKTGIINWSNKQKEQQIKNLIKEFKEVTL